MGASSAASSEGKGHRGVTSGPPWQWAVQGRGSREGCSSSMQQSLHASTQQPNVLQHASSDVPNWSVDGLWRHSQLWPCSRHPCGAPNSAHVAFALQ